MPTPRVNAIRAKLRQIQQGWHVGLHEVMVPLGKERKGGKQLL